MFGGTSDQQSARHRHAFGPRRLVGCAPQASSSTGAGPEVPVALSSSVATAGGPIKKDKVLRVFGLRGKTQLLGAGYNIQHHTFGVERLDAG